MALDHWHTKAARSTLLVEDLEELRSKYQILAEVELRLRMVNERAFDARPMEFTLNEEALWRLPEVAPLTRSGGRAESPRGGSKTTNVE